jgi:hypothetical protein
VSITDGWLGQHIGMLVAIPGRLWQAPRREAALRHANGKNYETERKEKRKREKKANL